MSIPPSLKLPLARASAAWESKSVGVRDSLTIAAIAIFIRIVAAAQLGGSILFARPIGDALWFDRWAMTLARGQGGPPRVFYLEPLYPYLMAVIYWFVGHQPGLIRFIQHALGVLTSVVAYRLAEAIFSRRAGYFAGLLSAGYGLYLFYEQQLLKETLAVFLISYSTLVLLHCAREPIPKRFLWPGFLTGLTILLRGNVYLYLPLLTLWIFLIARRDERSGYSGAFAVGIFGLGVALALAPVTLRNRVVGHDWVLSTYQGGPNFYIGNNPQANGIYSALKESREGPPWEEEDAVSLAEQAQGHKLKSSEVSSYWFHRAIGFIREHPQSFVKLVWTKLTLLWNAQEVPDYIDITEAAQEYGILNLPGFSFSVVGPLGLLGFVLLLLKRRWDPATSLLAVYVGGAVLSATLFYVFARYRMVLIPFVILLAAFAMDSLWDQTARREWSSTGCALAALAAMAVWVNVAWVRPYTQGVTYQTEATLYSEAGDFEHAVTAIRRAIAASPTQPSPRLFLAKTYQRLGNKEAAIQAYEQTLDVITRRNDPSLESLRREARMALSLLYAQKGDKGRAGAILREESATTPDSFEALVALGNGFQRAGQMQAAEEKYRKALGIQPRNPVVLNNLANLLRDQGNFDEAEALYERALAEAPNNAVILKNRGLLAQRRKTRGGGKEQGKGEGMGKGRERARARQGGLF